MFIFFLHNTLTNFGIRHHDHDANVLRNVFRIFRYFSTHFRGWPNFEGEKLSDPTKRKLARANHFIMSQILYL